MDRTSYFLEDEWIELALRYIIIENFFYLISLNLNHTRLVPISRIIKNNTYLSRKNIV